MTANNSLAHLMPVWLERIELVLNHWLPQAERHPHRLHQAMRYSALEGGKRIRPLLIYATGLATHQSLDQLDGPACAVELMHVYSLIHDDLPCMDDDDLRRGKPTSHKAFDEATAVLAGDALQALSFQILSSDPNMTSLPGVRSHMIKTLSSSVGSRGMAGGQAIDLDSVGRKLSITELEAMHIHKTGALIRASMHMATLNKPDLTEATTMALDHYAKCVGLAFQIRDDILDVEGDTETLGKQSGADIALDKPTFPGTIGMAASKEQAQRLHEEAHDSISMFGTEANVLRDIANFIVARIH